MGFYSYLRSLVLCALAIMLVASCALRSPAPPQVADRKLPQSAAILPFQNATQHDGVAQDLRTAFYNAFSSKKYIDVELSAVDVDLAGLKDLPTEQLYALPPSELGRRLGCDGLVYGRVSDFQKIYAGLYSQFGIEAEVWMVDAKTNQEVCRVRDAVRYHGWMLPTSLMSALVTGAETALNLREIQKVRLLHELCYKLAAQIPEPALCAAVKPEPVREDSVAVAVAAEQAQQPKPTDDNSTIAAGVEQVPAEQTAEITESGYRSFAQGDYGTAAALLGKTLRSSPEAQTYCILSLCLHQSNDVDQALTVLKEGVRRFPQDSALWKSLGLLLYELGDRNGARSAFQEVLRFKPDDATIALLLPRLQL